MRDERRASNILFISSFISRTQFYTHLHTLSCVSLQEKRNATEKKNSPRSRFCNNRKVREQICMHSAYNPAIRCEANSESESERAFARTKSNCLCYKTKFIKIMEMRKMSDRKVWRCNSIFLLFGHSHKRFDSCISEMQNCTERKII